MKQNSFISKMKKQLKNLIKGLKNKNTGFFILALCICLISTAIIWKYTSSGTDKDKNYSSDSISANEDPYKDYVDKTIEDYENSLNDNILNSSDKQNENNNNENDIDSKNESTTSILESFAKPISGKIAREYNINELVYYEAIEEWRIHQGLDIIPDGSLAVNAAYAGTVESVNSSSLMGVEIVIDHGNNIKTIYGCLSSCQVNTGDKVIQGEKIGTLGVTENIEMGGEPHLHYEISINGESYDPTIMYQN